MLSARKRRLLLLLVLLVVLTVIVLALAGAAMQITRSTLFKLDLAAKNVSFVSAEDKTVQLMGSTPFTELTLHGIEYALLTRASLIEKNDTTRAAAQTEHLNGTKFQVSGESAYGADLVISPLNGAMALNSAKALGKIEPVFLNHADRADVSILAEKPGLSMSVRNQPLRIPISIDRKSKIEFIHAKITKIDGERKAPVEGNTFILQPESDEIPARVDANGVNFGPVVTFIPPSASNGDILLTQNLRVSALDFPASKLIGDPGLPAVAVKGTIHIENVEGKPDINVKEGDFLILFGLDNFSINKMTFDPKGGVFHIEAAGYAGSLRHGPKSAARERTVTWFDSVWHQSWSMNLFAIAIWMFSTILAAYKLIKELQK